MRREEWREIERDPRYSVSSLGRVTGQKGQLLKPGRHPKGYLLFGMAGKTTYIHREVCRAFHGPKPTPQHQAAHWNGIPSDNRVENLRWATPSENSLDSVRHGGCTVANLPKSGEGNPFNKLKQVEVDEIRSLYATGKYTQAQLGEMFGTSRTNVGAIVRNEQWLGESA